MHQDFLDIIKQATGAADIRLIEVIQELWSGYGAIMRYRLTDADRNHVVVKHVKVPAGTDHPRGWNTYLSHQRKLHSYQVETVWYSEFSARCDSACVVPQCLAIETRGDETLMVFEDLDESGFSARRELVTDIELITCLRWLANFHATFLGCSPAGLWPQGTYWHLDTRPDELEALDDLPLKQAASAIDQLLKDCPWQTLVHGDAKLANFCFSLDGTRVAAVDFQYVGGGCGMKDLAYFIGSCLSDGDCERREAWLLERYFTELRQALARKQPGVDAGAVESSWRELFPVAWTDFHRFLKGWSPGHWKLNVYSERLARAVVARLNP